MAESARVPVFCYGWASDRGARLEDIRRSLGYFDGSRQSSWVGATFCSRPALLQPDYGAQDVVVDPARGVTCVGAAPWITNYNVPLRTADLALGRRVARALSQRTPGGLPSVQTMALLHGGGVEVACNLLDHAVTPPELVDEKLRELCREEGVEVGEAYVIGKRVAEIVAELEAV
jgi:glutamate formiminotransferase